MAITSSANVVYAIASPENVILVITLSENASCVYYVFLTISMPYWAIRSTTAILYGILKKSLCFTSCFLWQFALAAVVL